MKIYGLYLEDKIITGGARRYIELLTSIAKKGVKTAVFVNKELVDEFSPFCVYPVPIKLKKRRRISVQLAKQIKSFLKKNTSMFRDDDRVGASPDEASYLIIFGETDWLSAKVFCKFFAVKIVFAYRSDEIEEIHSFFRLEHLTIQKKCFFFLRHLLLRKREKEITKKASLLVFQTDNDKNHVLKRNPKMLAKTCVIPNDILQDRFKLEYKNKNESSKCRHILFVGNYDIRKGFNILLYALGELRQLCITYKVRVSVLARGNIKREQAKLIDNLALGEILRFEDANMEAQELMIACDLLVVPSLFDSFPNVIMEALHVGCPILASNVSGIPYMLTSPELRFDVASPLSLAKKIKELIESVDSYKNLWLLCKAEKVKFEFDWSALWLNAMENL